jgi:hypothetical protein
MLLIKILILFFIILIIYQLFLEFNKIEGFDDKKYEPYDINNPSNALILAQQNAGNIDYIKSRLDDYENLNKKFQDLSGNYSNLQKQVDDLVEAQQEYADNITGGTAPEISGTIDETENVDSGGEVAINEDTTQDNLEI